MKTQSIIFLTCTLSTTASAARFDRLKSDHENGIYKASADVYLSAPLTEVRAVLTDYNNLSRISNSIRESNVVSKLNKKTNYVHTVVRACFVIFCNTLEQVQRITINSPTEITAVTIPGVSQARSGKTVWILRRQGDGTLLHWRTEIAPTIWIPPLIGPALVEHMIRDSGVEAARGIERLARQRAGLPALASAGKTPPKQRQ